MENQITQVSRPPAKGCLGCFGRLIGIFALGGLCVLAITAAFAPWGFYMGGHFHWIPMWQGWGRLHSPTAGDYVLLVFMSPSPGGRGRAGVKGTAELCTPRGERFSLQLGGNMNRRGWFKDTEGEPLHLYMHRRTWFVGRTDHRPQLDLYGAWHTSDLVMDDHGALSRAFLADGSLNTGQSRNQPYARPAIQITLREGSKSDFESACSASKR